MNAYNCGNNEAKNQSIEEKEPRMNRRMSSIDVGIRYIESKGPLSADTQTLMMTNKIHDKLWMFGIKNQSIGSCN